MKLMLIWAVASRLVRQVVRDRRLFGLIFLAPIVVMILASLVIRAEKRCYSLGVYAEGPMSLFARDVVDKLQQAGFQARELTEQGEPERLVRSRVLDGAIIIEKNFLVERAEGKSGGLRLLVEGADPMAEIAILADLRDSLTKVVAGMPVLLSPDCPQVCAEGINTAPPAVTIARLSGQGLDMVDFFLPGVIPLIAFFFGYLLTALSFLRERSGGTLERLMASPIGRHEIVAGYFFGFLGFGLLQSAVITAVAVWILRMPNQAGLMPLTGLLVLVTSTAAGLGLFLSTFAKTEIQVAQFIPIIILPQVFLCGLIWPIPDLPAFLRPVSWSLPLTYAVQSARELMIRGDAQAALVPTAILALFCSASVVLASLTMRSRIIS